MSRAKKFSSTTVLLTFVTVLLAVVLLIMFIAVSSISASLRPEKAYFLDRSSLMLSYVELKADIGQYNYWDMLNPFVNIHKSSIGRMVEIASLPELWIEIELFRRDPVSWQEKEFRKTYEEVMGMQTRLEEMQFGFGVVDEYELFVRTDIPVTDITPPLLKGLPDVMSFDIVKMTNSFLESTPTSITTYTGLLIQDKGARIFYNQFKPILPERF